MAMLGASTLEFNGLNSSEFKMPGEELSELATRVSTWVKTRAKNAKVTLAEVAKQEYVRRDKNLLAKDELIAKNKALLEATPGNGLKKTWLGAKTWLMEMSRVVDRPMSYLGAAGRSAAMLAFYEWNPLRPLISKMWTTEINGISGRELAARLEEKLITDKVTGKGVRTGAITKERISDAIAGGFKLATTMQLIPNVLSQLPMIQAIGATPGEIWGVMRSSKMLAGGPGSIASFKKLWNETTDTKERAKIVGIAACSAPLFYFLEKLSPVLAGVNPVLLADMGLMRFVSTVEKYIKVGGHEEGPKQALEATALQGQMMAVELGITAAFTGDTAVSLGERVVTYKETGMINPLAHIKSEGELVSMANKNPLHLVGEGGGIPGAIRRAEEELFAGIKSWAKQEAGPREASHAATPMQLKDANGEMATYMVSKDGDKVVITKEVNGKVAVLTGTEWQTVSTQPKLSEKQEGELVRATEENLAQVETVARQAVHDYVIIDEVSHDMAIRMDLRPGETVRDKFERLFSGAIDDPSSRQDIFSGEELKSNTMFSGEELKNNEMTNEDLAAAAGGDLVYERQIVAVLLGRLRADAQSNGIVVDEAEVMERMIRYFEENTSLSSGMVEGELAYDGLYEYLYTGMKVDPAQMTDYKPYFLSGNEGLGRGVEHTFVAEPGDSLSQIGGELGYTISEDGIFDGAGNPLPGAVVYQVNSEGGRDVVDPKTFGSIAAGQQYIIHTGEGLVQSTAAGEAPVFVTAATDIQDEAAQVETPGPESAEESVLREEEWRSKPLRNDKGEIYLGEVGRDGDTLSELIMERLGATFRSDENPNGAWGTIWPMLLSQDSSGLAIYVQGADGEREYLRTKEQMDQLSPGEKVIIVDNPKQPILRQIEATQVPEPEKIEEVEKVNEETQEEEQGAVESKLSVGADSDGDGIMDSGKLNYGNPPQELIKDAEGMMYLGSVQPGNTLSGLVIERLGEYMDDNSAIAKLTYFRLGQDGETLEPLDPESQLNVGDLVFAQDNVTSPIFGEELVPVYQAPELPGERGVGLALPESVEWDHAKLESELVSANQAYGDNAVLYATVVGIGSSDTLSIKGELAISNDCLLAPTTMIWAAQKIASGELAETEEVAELLRDAQEDSLALAKLGQLVTGKQGDEWVASVDDYAQDTLGLGRTELARGVTTTNDMATLMTSLATGKYLNSADTTDLIELMGATNSGITTRALGAESDAKIIEFASGNTVVALVVAESGSYVVATAVEGRLANDSASLQNLALRTVYGAFDPTFVNSATQLTHVIAQAKSDPAAATALFGKIIYPKTDDLGVWQLNQKIGERVAAPEEIDWATMQRDVRGQQDMLLTLSAQDDTREIAILVDKSMEVSSVLDTKLAVGEEGIFEKVMLSAARENTFSSESVHVAPVYSFGMNVSGASGREQLISYMSAMGQDFDYVLFSSQIDGKPVLVATGYEQGETGEAGVRIGVVLANGGQQVSAADKGVLTRFLGESITSAKWYVATEGEATVAPDELGMWCQDLVSTQGSPAEAGETTTDAWVNQVQELAATLQDSFAVEVELPENEELSLRIQQITQSYEESENMTMAQVLEGLGMENQNVVDGVRYLGVAYVGEQKLADRYLIGQEYGLTAKDVILRETSEAGTYLVGTSVAYGAVSPDAPRAYIYDDELVGQVVSSELSGNEAPEQIFQLERDLATAVTTQDLVKLERGVSSQRFFDAYQVQRADSKYFVPATGNLFPSNHELYVDPLTMNVYVFEQEAETYGEDYREEAGFYPVFGADLTISEMAQVLSERELDPAKIEMEVYETVLTNQAFLALRQVPNRYYVSMTDSVLEVTEQRDPSVRVQLTLLTENDSLVLTQDNHVVYQDAASKLWAITENGLETVEEGATKTCSEELAKGYSMLVDDEGVPLQRGGAPLFAKNELIYQVTAEGLVVVDSIHTNKSSTFVADPAVLAINKLMGPTAVTQFEGEFGRDDLASEVDKIRHDIALNFPQYYLETTYGLYDTRDQTVYRIGTDEGQLLLDSVSGKPVLEKIASEELASLEGLTVPKEYFVHNDAKGELAKVSPENLTRYNDGLELLIVGGREFALAKNEAGLVYVDRQTRMPIYTSGDEAYVVKAGGITRLGLTQGLVEVGLVGVINRGEYEVDKQEFMPAGTNLVTSLTLAAYLKYFAKDEAGFEKVAEGISRSLEGSFEIMADGVSLVVPGDRSRVTDVLDIINGDKYIPYESIPASYIQMLLAQEDKRFMDYDEGDARNIHPVVMAQVGSGRGGSTLAQQVAKNIFMSTEERLDPDQKYERKIKEFGLADQLLEDFDVEQIMELYVNTMTYGYDAGGPIIGIERASEVVFGKPFRELLPWEQSLLVVMPNNPARFNGNSGEENLRDWAVAAASVYHHAEEIGVMTAGEAELGKNEIFFKLLPSGDEKSLALVTELVELSPEDAVRLAAIGADYGNIDYDARFAEDKTYIDFYTYLAKIAPGILSSENLALVAAEYYGNYSLKSLSGDVAMPSGNTPFGQTIPIADPARVQEIATEKEAVVTLDAPELHVEELSIKDAAGLSMKLEKIALDSKENPIYRSPDNQLYTLLPDGTLERNPGTIYSVAGSGETVVTMPVTTRPFAIVGSNNSVVEGRLVQDGIGNVYKLEGEEINYAGRIYVADNGVSVMYEIPRLDELPRASATEHTYQTVVDATLRLLKVDAERMAEVVVPTDSANPNKGVVPVVLEGSETASYRANPSVVAEAISQAGVYYEQVELMDDPGSERVFEQLLVEQLATGKPVVAWVNMSDEFERKLIEERAELTQVFEGFGKLERPVVALSTFDYNGEKYVVFLDPLVNDPKVVPLATFVQWGAPWAGRYKMLIPDSELAKPEGYSNYATTYDAASTQVDLALATGHTLDFESPTAIENMMTINPNMQNTVIQAGREMMRDYETDGMTAIAVDENGKVIFNVSLDGEGKILPGNVAGKETFPPGSVAKIASALFAMTEMGVDPNVKTEGGEWYEFAPGYKALNWRTFEYGGNVAPASATMTVTEALFDSNDPWFLSRFYESDKLVEYGKFLERIGLGAAGVYSPGLPNRGVAYVEPENRALAAYAAMGQGNLRVTAEQLLALEYAVMHEGKVIGISAAVDGQPGQPVIVGQLPGTPEDFAVIKDALGKVTSYFEYEGVTRHGTASNTFDNPYDPITDYVMVGGKTGTAETGGNPHASFVGTAIDPVTGREINIYVVIKNVVNRDPAVQAVQPAGGGSLAAPVAKQIMDVYFADPEKNSVRTAESPTITVRAQDGELASELPSVVPTETTTSGVNTLEIGMRGYKVAEQPNAHFILASYKMMELAQAYIDSTGTALGSGEELRASLVEGMKADQILAPLLESKGMQDALTTLERDYDITQHDNNPNNDKQPIQCVGWQIMNSALEKAVGSPEDIKQIILTDAATQANIMLSLPHGTDVQQGGGVVARFARDTEPTIEEMRIGDTVYASYTPTRGHVMTILSKGFTEHGEPAVLVQDSNHELAEGKVAENGMPHIRWMTQEQFVREYQLEGNTARFVINRLGGEGVVAVNTEPSGLINYSEWQIPEMPAMAADGGIVISGAEYVPTPEPEAGLNPPKWLYVHWVGNENEIGPDGVAQAMQENGDSTTFIVGDTVAQTAKMTESAVQETNAAWQRDDAINIEVIGNDFDNTPPSEATYTNLLNVTLANMIKYNLPLSSIKGHYEDYYVSHADGSKDRVAIEGEDINQDGNIDPNEISQVFALDENGEPSTNPYPFAEGDSWAWQKMDPGVEFMEKFRRDLRRILTSAEGGRYRDLAD